MNTETIKKDFFLPRLRSGEEIMSCFNALVFALIKKESMSTRLLHTLFVVACALVTFFVSHSLWAVLLSVLVGSVIVALYYSYIPKNYYLAITNVGIHCVYWSCIIPLMRKSPAYDFYNFDEIEQIKIDEGYSSTTLALDLKNGKKVSFFIPSNQHPGLTAKGKEYLLSKYK